MLSLQTILKVTICARLAFCLVLAVEFVVVSSAMGGSRETCRLPMFDNPEYCVPRRPLSVATADLDGDGNLDLVATLQFGTLPDTIAVLFGRGDGTFGDMVTYDGGFEPMSVAVGDLDDDGHPDLVVADAAGFGQQGNILVFLNAGDGTFPDRMVHGVGPDPNSVALGDLDGDGDLDIAAAVTGNNVVTTFRNNGNGTFVFGANYPTDMPQAIAIGDLNGDGANDFVTANWPQDVVSVRLNNGDGTFGSSVLYDSGTRPISVAVGDLDGDGDADLVVGNAGTTADHGTTVSVLQNNGDGTFSAPVPFDAGDFPTCVHLADLDGDDDLDLAVSNLWSDDVSVLLNNGDATFAPQSRTSAGSGPYAVTSGDFDGDGAPDLTVANCFGDTLSVLPNLGDGTFQDVTNHDVGPQPTAMAIGDLDGDGDLDLAITTSPTARTPGGISIMLNDGNPDAPGFVEAVSLAAGYSLVAVVMADLDGDGNLDLAVANELDASVSILLNNGNASFADEVMYTAGAGARAIAVGDLDGDGNLDLAVANAGDSNVSILLNNGDGTFAADVTFPVGGGDFSVPYSVALGDVDGDGDLDLATANLKPFNVSVLLNNGDGTFGGEVTYPFFLPHSVAFGDLDGDGDLDLITANDFIWISLNDGDGHFGAPIFLPSCSGSFFAATADLDGDGDLDIVVKDRSNTVGFLSNNGDATFAEIELFRVGSEPFGVAVGDLNGDGALDLAAPNFDSNSVSILLNRSNDCFGTPGDLNGDGVVGPFDLAMLLASWGPCADCENCPADLDGDCNVGPADLAVLLANWG